MRGTNPLDFDLSSLDPLRNPNLGFDAFLPKNNAATSAPPPPPAVCNPTYGAAPSKPQPPALNRNTTQGAFANFGAQTIGQTPNNSGVSTVVPYGGTLGRSRPSSETSTSAQFVAGNYNTIQVARGSKTSSVTQQSSNPTRAISPPVDRPASATNNAFAAFGSNFGASSSAAFGSGAVSGATFGEQSGAGFGSGSGTPIGSGTGTPVTESFGAIAPSTSSTSPAVSPGLNSAGRPPSDLMDFSAFNEIEEEFMTLESFDPLLSSTEQTGSTNGNDAMENLAFFADSAGAEGQQGVSAASAVEAFKPPSVPSASPAHMTGIVKWYCIHVCR